MSIPEDEMMERNQSHEKNTIDECSLPSMISGWLIMDNQMNHHTSLIQETTNTSENELGYIMILCRPNASEDHPASSGAIR